MGFLARIFGGGQKAQPMAPPPQVIQPERDPQTLRDQSGSELDPNRDKQLAEAARQRKRVMARRGRSSLVTSRNTNDDETSGVAIRS
jgi:hypothetical protein